MKLHCFPSTVYSVDYTKILNYNSCNVRYRVKQKVVNR